MKPALRGPGLPFKLMLLSLALLVLPWLSYQLMVQMAGILFHWQSQTQLRTAEGISTLLNGRDDLFSDFPVRLEDFESLYVHPLAQGIRVDGKATEWETQRVPKRSFGLADDGSGDGGFVLQLGESDGYLYALLDVNDHDSVLRDTEVLRLDNADQVRISYRDLDGRDHRVVLTLQADGSTAYQTGKDWRFAFDGPPETRINSAFTREPGRHLIEFRIPLALLGHRRDFGIAYIDVDDPISREISGTTQTLPTGGLSGFNLVVLRSPEVLNIIQGLGYAGARVLVVDAQSRVRAEVGSHRDYLTATTELPTLSRFESWLEPARPWAARVLDTLPIELGGPTAADSDKIGAEVVATSLDGKPIALRRRLANGEEIIMAGYPIISRDRIIGTVVLEENTDEIIALQRQGLERIVVVSVLGFLIVMVVMLAFAVRLAWRIRSLRKETSNAIDRHGRLQTESLRAQINAGDEIGDLARSISNLISKLHQHTRFLETIPRTLRHELNNPLNTVSTSLQNLEHEFPELDRNPYLASAQRGVLRIGGIVQHLADAASLEESLESEELELIDLRDFVFNYVNNCRVVHTSCEFVLQGAAEPAYTIVCDYRIEQLLDKIIDNAVDFHTPGTPVSIQFDVEREYVKLTVANRGPTISEEMLGHLFDSMISSRISGDAKVHFGLGLYVVRVIAEHHGGSVSAANLPDGSGVAITIRLPRTDEGGRANTPLGLITARRSSGNAVTDGGPATNGTANGHSD